MQKHNDPFVCENCQKENKAAEVSERNHCSFCLYSKHLDLNKPGDRLSSCRAMMIPTMIDSSGKKGMMLIHQCTKCKKRISNKLADDDNWDLVIKLSTEQNIEAGI